MSQRAVSRVIRGMAGVMIAVALLATAVAGRPAVAQEPVPDLQLPMVFFLDYWQTATPPYTITITLTSREGDNITGTVKVDGTPQDYVRGFTNGKLTYQNGVFALAANWSVLDRDGNGVPTQVNFRFREDRTNCTVGITWRADPPSGLSGQSRNSNPGGPCPAPAADATPAPAADPASTTDSESGS